MTQTVIAGAGAVGICCAIALAEVGHRVTLVDPGAPAQATSRWNAGVLATSSVIPLNNPGLFAKLPRLLSGTHPGFHLNLRAAPGLAGWSAQFLRHATAARSARTVAALRALIGHSLVRHTVLAQAAGTECLQRGGWLICYRGAQGVDMARAQAAALAREEVMASVLTGEELQALEPALGAHFAAAVHATESMFTDPVTLTTAYLDHARHLGVTTGRARVTSVRGEAGHMIVSTDASEDMTADHVVVTAGAWTNDILTSCARPLPFAVERGYLQRFALDAEQCPTRPFFDVAGGYVAAARAGGVQISSGTELTRLHTPPNTRRFARTLDQAKRVLPLGAPLQTDIAVGNRPTLPDSLPVIGLVPDRPGLWVAAGHQHIGFSTSAGTADLLAHLMTGQPPPIDAKPFAYDRFFRAG